MSKKNHKESHLEDADEKRLDKRFYFLDAELFKRFKDEEERIHGELLQEKELKSKEDNEEDTDNRAYTVPVGMSIEELNRLQQDIERLRKIQKKMRDESLDNFKELIFPFVGVVPALGLFGVAALSIVVGPVVALLFSGAFFLSNLYIKGISSSLNIYFGISTLMQAGAVAIGIVILAGIAVFNPIVVPILVVSGGVLLFLTAMERGRRRQKKAETICLPRARMFIKRVKGLREKIANNIKHLNVIKTTKVDDKKEKGKDLGQQDRGIHLEEMIKEFVLTGDFDKLNKAILSSTALKNKEDLIMDIKELKVAYDMMCYDLDDFENLLRTVKNPIEKRSRILEIREIQKDVDDDSSSGLSMIKEEMSKKIKEVSEEVDHVWKKDIPWLSVNIGVKVAAFLCSAVAVGVLADVAFKLGIGIVFTPLVLNPVGMAVILASTLCVGGIFALAKYQKKARYRKEKEHQKQDMTITMEDREKVKSDEMKKSSGRVSMFLEEPQSLHTKRSVKGPREQETEKTQSRKKKDGK